MKRKHSILLGLVLTGLLALVVACGSNNNSGGNPTSSPTPSPGPSPSPSPTPGPGQITCQPVAFAVGVKVLYAGQKGNGTPFPDPNKAYTGTVKNYYTDGTADVEWTQLNNVVVNEPIRVLMPHADCTPDISGRGVKYIGQASPNFPDPTHTTYSGKLVEAYAGSNFEVKWDHLSYDTVEVGSDLALGAQ
jgi:hypothetical protein